MTDAGPPEPESAVPTAPADPLAEGEAAPKLSPMARLKAKLGGASGAFKGGASGALGFAKSFRSRGQGIGQAVLSIPSLLVRGDLTTRLLAVGFIASLLLLGITGNQILRRLAAKFEKPPASHVVNPQIERDKQLVLMGANVVFLERFTGTLEAKSGQPASFEIELYVEVDAPESASVLRAHMLQTREMVSTAIQGRKYEELNTEEGKEALKDDIREAVTRTIQRWSKKGQIKNVYFTHFVMT